MGQHAAVLILTIEPHLGRAPIGASLDPRRREAGRQQQPRRSRGHKEENAVTKNYKESLEGSYLLFTDDDAIVFGLPRVLVFFVMPSSESPLRDIAAAAEVTTKQGDR